MDICLNLIVKNESSNIERCLNSFNRIKYRLPTGEIKEAIKAIAIVDTGSSDNTIGLAEKWAASNHKKGGVLNRPWKEDFFHFSANRNIALEYAYATIEGNRKKGDNWYILFTDADNLIHPPEGEDEIVLPPLTMDKYMCPFRNGGLSFPGNLAVKYDPGKGWIWVGAVHEYLTVREECTSGYLTCLWMDARCEGFRSRNEFKYLRDVKHIRLLLEKCQEYKEREVRGVYEDDEAANISRYSFYLAQSIRDSGFGMEKQAEDAYIARAKMGDGYQEVYVSFLEAYKQRVKRKGRVDKKGASYLEKAFDTDPDRLEAPYYYAKYLNNKRRFNQAWNFCKPLLGIQSAENKLFTESYVYDYAFVDEVGVSAFYTKDNPQAKPLFEKALAKAPASQRDRILSNILLCG